MASQIPVRQKVVVYGKPTKYQNRWNMPHPEVELEAQFEQRKGAGLQPIYRTSEKLTQRGLSSAGLAKAVRTLLAHPQFSAAERLPEAIRTELKFPSRPMRSGRCMHRKMRRKPSVAGSLKFEELLLLQIKLLQQKQAQTQDVPGVRFGEVGELFNAYYSQHIPFELTGGKNA